MSMTVQRDPFARGGYKRFTHGNRDLVHSSMGCDWCGSKPARLYSYIWVRDDEQEPQKDSGYWYCKFACFQDYCQSDRTEDK